MSRLRAGDIVAYREKGKRQTVVAKVLRWSGDPDSQCVLITAQGKKFRPYADSVERLEGDVARAFRLEIDQYLETKPGREALAAAIARTIRPNAMGVMPAGSGAPEFCEEPMQMARGMTSDPTDWLLHYVRGSWTEALRLKRALRSYNARYADVLLWNVERGESLPTVATRLGITPANARQIKSRALAWSRDYIFTAIFGKAS